MSRRSDAVMFDPFTLPRLQLTSQCPKPTSRFQKPVVVNFDWWRLLCLF
jgi:hypothetical protein